jgi:hypothetical protein
MLPLGNLASPGVGVTAFALAVFNATQVGTATVRASSSAQAVGFFNGKEIFRDK